MRVKLSKDCAAVNPEYLGKRLEEHLLEDMPEDATACVVRMIELAHREDSPIHTLHQLAHQMRQLIALTHRRGHLDNRKVALGILNTHGISLIPGNVEASKTTYTLRSKQGDLPL